MNQKLNRTLLFLSLFGTTSTTMAQAQNQQQFLPNVENGIVNDMNSGAINSNQAKQLQNRANAIQSQELRDMSQNNGSLTPQEQKQINRESARLNQSAHSDVRQDNPNSNFNQNWRSQYNSNGQQWNQNNPNNQQFGQNGNQNRRRPYWFNRQY